MENLAFENATAIPVAKMDSKKGNIPKNNQTKIAGCV